VNSGPLKEKVKESGYSYADISKHSGVALWKLKSFFTDKHLSDKNLLEVINAIDSFFESRNAIRQKIAIKTKKILQH
jgi:hypothetical protein